MKLTTKNLRSFVVDHPEQKKQIVKYYNNTDFKTNISFKL